MRRRRPVLFLTAITGVVAGALARASAAAAACPKLPALPLAPDPLASGCRAARPATPVVAHPDGIICSLICGPIRSVGDAVMKGVTDWVADGAAWLVTEAGKLIDATATPSLTAPWFSGQYQTMAELAAVFALPLLLLTVLQAVLRRDGGAILRAAAVHLPAAFLLTAGAVVVVGMFITITDQMCDQLAGSSGGGAQSFFAHMGAAITQLAHTSGDSGAAPLFAVFLGGLIAAVGAFFVWVELLIRSAAIYVAVLFLPFTLVAMIWPHTSRWCRKLVEFLTAVIFAKFVILAIMALAAAGLFSADGSQSFQSVLAGTALMLLAAFSPLALLRLIPMVESAAQSTGRPGAGAQALGPVAGPAAVMRRVSDGNWGAGSGGLRAAPVGASGLPAPGRGTGGTSGASTDVGMAAVGTGAATAGGHGRAQSGGPSDTAGSRNRSAATSPSGADVARPTTTTPSTSSPAAGSSTPASAMTPDRHRPSTPQPPATSGAGATRTTGPGTPPHASAAAAPTSVGSGTTSAGASPPDLGGSAPTGSTGRASGPGSAVAESPSSAARSPRPPIEPPRDPARQRAENNERRNYEQ